MGRWKLWFTPGTAPHNCEVCELAAELATERLRSQAAEAHLLEIESALADPANFDVWRARRNASAALAGLREGDASMADRAWDADVQAKLNALSAEEKQLLIEAWDGCPSEMQPLPPDVEARLTAAANDPNDARVEWVTTL